MEGITSSETLEACHSTCPPMGGALLEGLSQADSWFLVVPARATHIVAGRCHLDTAKPKSNQRASEAWLRFHHLFVQLPGRQQWSTSILSHYLFCCLRVSSPAFRAACKSCQGFAPNSRAMGPILCLRLLERPWMPARSRNVQCTYSFSGVLQLQQRM
mmetsp:Transcript_37332/g.89272  ORF Transcript_37332/g.89272 Transcript_37332/m.89272 type:complete len:158 (+) Transcript_37332:426-899(+)